MPGVTTTSRDCGSARRSSSASDVVALAGFDEKVLSITVTPEADVTTCWRWSLSGRESRRGSTTSSGRSRARTMPRADATLAG